MALNLISYEQGEDDYIDMEVNSFSTFFSNSITSPHHTPNFHDLLNLFPLHLTPPTLQMVQKLLKSPNSPFLHAPKTTLQNPPTPSNLSTKNLHMTKKPSLGSKLKAYGSHLKSFFTNSSCSNQSHAPNPIKTAKQIQNTDSRPSTSCLFSCQTEDPRSPDSTVAARKSHKGKYAKDSSSSKKHKRSLSTPIKAAKQNKIEHIQNTAPRLSTSCLFSRQTEGPRSPNSTVAKKSHKEKYAKDSSSSKRHRRSLSAPIKTHSRNNPKSLACSSYSCSNKSNHCCDQSQIELKRSNSMKSEMESPIQGAIAHCKQSQLMIKKDQNSAGDEISR